MGEMYISTHAPRTGSDSASDESAACRNHFNPRSPHGERQKSSKAQTMCWTFQPTLPARGATDELFASSGEEKFQPTLPARGATRSLPRHSGRTKFQPTLPARGATTPQAHPFRRKQISTHAPRTGSDDYSRSIATTLYQFQPTLPARGATSTPMTACSGATHFNPRSPHGERQGRPHGGVHRLHISTHAPRTGSDDTQGRANILTQLFQPTLPARGATCTVLVVLTALF